MFPHIFRSVYGWARVPSERQKGLCTARIFVQVDKTSHECRNRLGGKYKTKPVRGFTGRERNEMNKPLTEREIVLVMTICELLGTWSDVAAVQTAFQNSEQKLEQWRNRPTQGEVLGRRR